jgi:pimeloyl-ACP methyl ester carboxylesterase
MLTYTIYGQGKPVVFLHGFLLDSEGWRFFRPDEEEFQSIFIDLPGHGASADFLPEVVGLNEYAQAVLEVLTFLAIESYDLVGHSMGGYIGLELMRSARPPQRLILFHSNHWSDSPERKKNRDRVGPVVQQNKRLFLRESIPLLFANVQNHQAQLADSIERAALMQPEAIIHAAQSMKIRPNLATLVTEHAEKCWLIQGDKDKLIPIIESRAAWSGKLTHFVVIPDCGHMGHFEQPQLCMDAITHALKQKTES